MRTLASLLLLLSSAVSAFAMQGVVGTRHNLSASGPGTVTATDENRVCIFCHTPHHADVSSLDYMPLWSRDLSTANYAPYDSSTLKAQPGQPTGASRLCLACHDGTIALGMLKGGYQISSLGKMPAGGSKLDTVLTDDHPISFDYTADLALASELHAPSALPGAIRLDNGRVECLACHDPHKNDYGRFLVMDNTDSALCTTCHDKQGWSSSTHQPPAASCESCHAPHNAGQPARLLREASEEDTCTANCHNGSGSGVDVAAEFTRAFRHPLTATTGLHRPDEDPLTVAYHVECADCHNPCQVNGTEATAPDVSGRLTGVKGVNASGAVVAEAAYEYEVCFKCHGDNSFAATAAVSRQITEVNERLRFDSANPSYHPVTAQGKNTSVPSLRSGYSTTSLIYCSDCHNNNGSAKAGGAGADGPHGSDFPQMLIARYELGIYPLAYAQSNYALCFRCHDPNLLFDLGTNFIAGSTNLHTTHVQTQGTPCAACHDPHGVPSILGATDTANAHLINFDTDIVDPLSASYDSSARTCTVSCHTTNPKSY